VLIVVDTNVIVSALLNPFGKPAAVLGLVLEEKTEICFDSRIIAEYREVLTRPRFKFNQPEVTAFLNYLTEIGKCVVAVPHNVRLKDPDDTPFAEVALSAAADCLVTGNTGHFPARIGSTATVTPARFLLKYFSQNK
jgi:putative PIN family toxin of toxin-antitoxin system